MFEVRLDDRPVPVPSLKQRAVLALLALDVNRRVSVDRLIEGIWGAQAPPSAPKMVQLHISHLRRLLGQDHGEIVTRGRGYELRLPADAVDAVRFERLVSERAGADALELWRGRALEDLADEPFAAAEIRRLDDLWLQAREVSVDAALAAGEHHAILGEVAELAAANPTREHLQAQRMLALYRCGRQAEALAAFREARAVLIDEVGIEPGPELRRLQDAILRQDAGLDVAASPPAARAPAAPTNLPADARPLIGRGPELAELADALTGTEQMVTILGLGGTGKTRLAIASARLLQTSFGGGAWLVSLVGIRDESALIGAIAAALGVSDQEPGGLDAAVARRLEREATLLVLDNFEQLVAAAPQVGALLGRAPDTRVLVTSQLPLRIAQERVMRLEPLDLDSAIELFDERAGRAWPGFDALVHRPTVEAICRSVEGLPLAVELAAARVAALAPAEVLSRLDESLAILTRGPRDLPERHRTLRAALEWTVDLLDPVERVLLARLGAFAGPVGLDAIQAVAGDDALDSVSGLVEASLVRRIGSSRYTLPQAVRDFAAERLAASGEEHAVRTAHADHLAAVGREWRFKGLDLTARERVTALAAEQRVALDWARAHARGTHARVAVALSMAMYETGRAREAWMELGVALEHTGVTGAVGGWGAIARGFVGRSLGRASGELVERGLAALRQGGDDRLLEHGLRMSGLFWGYAGDLERCIDHSAEALALARAGSDQLVLDESLLFNASALASAGRLDEADGLLEEAVRQPVAADSALAIIVRSDITRMREDWPAAARSNAASARMAPVPSNQLIADLQCAAFCLLKLGASDAALELEAMAAAIASSSGQVGIEDWVIADRLPLLAQARAELGAARVRAAEGRGRAVALSDAVARCDAIVETVLDGGS